LAFVALALAGFGAIECPPHRYKDRKIVSVKEVPITSLIDMHLHLIFFHLKIVRPNLLLTKFTKSLSLGSKCWSCATSVMIFKCVVKNSQSLHCININEPSE